MCVVSSFSIVYPGNRSYSTACRDLHVDCHGNDGIVLAQVMTTVGAAVHIRLEGTTQTRLVSVCVCGVSEGRSYSGIYRVHLHNPVYFWTHNSVFLIETSY